MCMSDRIKERRKALGFTQEDLANRLGLQKSAIAKYENGRVQNIKRSTILKMAECLECSPSYLMGLDDPSQPSYYMDEETAALAQEMFEDPDMRSLFHMKRNMDPERFKTHMDFIKTLYKQEHPDDNDTGC